MALCVLRFAFGFDEFQCQCPCSFAQCDVGEAVSVFMRRGSRLVSGLWFGHAVALREPGPALYGTMYEAGF